MMSKASPSNDFCIKCLANRNWSRPSMCKCNHCSMSFCFDCIREHHNELLEKIAELSHQHNVLKQSVDAKKISIRNETKLLRQQWVAWFQELINCLTRENSLINKEMDATERDAQKTILDVETELQTFSEIIQSFTKHDIFQPDNVQHISMRMEELNERIAHLSVIKEYSLPSVTPKRPFRFLAATASCLSTQLRSKENFNFTAINEEANTEKRQSDNSSDYTEDVLTTTENNNICSSSADNFCNRNRFQPTSYVVDCMASNGFNIMYSSIQSEDHYLIAYCYLNTKDTNFKREDPCRAWRQSRITDLIWWKAIDKFVCVTENTLYTIQYINEKFKISTIMNHASGQLCIATNEIYLWTYANKTLNAYNLKFEVVESIAVREPSSSECVSFSVAHAVFAFAITRRVQHNKKLLEIIFYGLDAKARKTVNLGNYKDKSAIRTDGQGRFFVVNGEQKFYIILESGKKQEINLGKQASCLAVVDTRHIVLTKSRSDLELVTC